MAELSYTLLVNDAPASPDLLDTIQQIEVEDHADMADMLRLHIAIGVRDDCSEWSVVDENIFSCLAKIRINIKVGSALSEPLIEAYVIETDANFSNQPGQSVLNVVAMDPTVLMNLQEKVLPWPNMSDSDIAKAIFQDGKYKDENGRDRDYNFLPVVKDTTRKRDDINETVIQRGTDMQFLRQLAKRNGYQVYVEINPKTGVTEGHFHPPMHDPEKELDPKNAQGTLSVNMGGDTNVNSFSVRYDMLRPTTAQVTGLDIATQADQPAQVESLALEELGREGTLTSKCLRRVLLSQTGLVQTDELQTYAQAVVDWSGWAITAEGELNTVAYGGILRAKHPVNVRGAGRQFSGTYYVERVLHTFTGEGYTQRFTLRRNALGLTGQERFMEDGALP